MAVKVVHVSDISGREADPEALGKLIVHEHPGFEGLPVTLEALPEEIEKLREATRFVTVEWIEPGARRGKRMTVSLDDFNLLGGPGEVDAAIERAMLEKARSRRGAAREGSARGRGRSRSRVNYATIEHAGEPHRGRITEAEKRIVRENLEEVNRRLREKGKREIDPNDPVMKERYGL